ncbi:hepcidin [Caloenas nicobarica]|uniref:hepcidin n=1 Tax=Caloenas nicobarica TaxID=187106 RepID=UPI0032B73408
MGATRDPRDVIGLSIIILLVLAESGSAVLGPPDSSLEPRPPARMGDGQVPAPFVSLLKVSPQKQLGDGQRRSRRHGSHFPLCSFCCGCCGNRGCGLCCRT